MRFCPRTLMKLMINLRNEIDKLPDTDLWKPLMIKLELTSDINTLLRQEQEKYQDILKYFLLLKNIFFLLSYTSYEIKVVILSQDLIIIGL